MREEAHRLAVKDSIRFIVHAVADLQEVQSRSDEEPVHVGLKIERRIRTLIQPYYISSTFLALVQLHYMSLRDTKRLLIDA